MSKSIWDPLTSSVSVLSSRKVNLRRLLLFLTTGRPRDLPAPMPLNISTPTHAYSFPQTTLIVSLRMAAWKRSKSSVVWNFAARTSRTVASMILYLVARAPIPSGSTVSESRLTAPTLAHAASTRQRTLGSHILRLAPSTAETNLRTPNYAFLEFWQPAGLVVSVLAQWGVNSELHER